MKAVINQESDWFDSNNPDELPTKINTEINAIKTGMSEKLGMLIKGAFMVGIGFVMGFIFGWKFAFVSLGMAPLLMIGMMAMGKFIKTQILKNMEAFNKSGAYAQ